MAHPSHPLLIPRIPHLNSSPTPIAHPLLIPHLNSSLTSIAHLIPHIHGSSIAHPSHPLLLEPLPKQSTNNCDNSSTTPHVHHSSSDFEYHTHGRHTQRHTQMDTEVSTRACNLYIHGHPSSTRLLKRTETPLFAEGCRSSLKGSVAIAKRREAEKRSISIKSRKKYTSNQG